MPATEILPVRPRTREEVRARWLKREQERVAEALRLVADELEREWTANAEDTHAWRSSAVARRMQRELEGTVRAGPFTADGPEINEVLVRFATAIRSVPAIAPDACSQCNGKGFVEVTNDIGEVCGICGGSGAIAC